MIIDDDEATRDVLRDLLSVRGFDVRTASNGYVALRELQLAAKAPCLILVDLKMPVMDGWGFLDEAHELPKLSSSRIVLMSGQRFAQKIEGIHMLSKPFRLDHLASFLHAVETACAVCGQGRPGP